MQLWCIVVRVHVTRLIDFGQFIMSLAKSQRLSTPARIKDNSVIWLIAQCLRTKSDFSFFLSLAYLSLSRLLFPAATRYICQLICPFSLLAALDNVKKLFVHDLTSNHGRLFLRMFEFHNAQQVRRWYSLGS
jgi:hypothetical protein